MTMTKHTLIFLVASVFALPLLALTPATAEARYGYGGHISVGYGHHGGHYRGHHGGHYRGYYRHGYRSHSRHGYSPRYHHRSRYYSRGYRSYGYRPGYRSYGYHGSHSPLYKLLAAPAYLAYGILKTPAVIIDSLTGSSHGHSSSTHAPATTATQGNNNSNASSSRSESVEPLLDNAAWNALAQGQHSAALSMFGQQAQANPRKGEPKIGYALAIAGRGDLDDGIWAMRRMLQYDINALHYLEFEGSLRRQVETLLARYESHYAPSATAENYAGDAAMMIATLNYLLGDHETAQRVVTTARAEDDDQALVWLDEFLQQVNTNS
ncbi:MAG: hypothetical protein WD572_08180 [Gammaproteobacteria bacterium]